MQEQLIVDGLSFELRRSNKRKTIGITIDRTGELVLSAPLDCPIEVMERVARSKYRWIHSRLAQKELFLRAPVTHAFLDGEGFYYLGRSYRLRLVDSPLPDTSPLRLYRGWFELRHNEVHRGQEHFTNWYREHGQQWLPQRVARFSGLVDATPKGIKVQSLGYRWGSCGRNEVLHFHWRTMLFPFPIIDYIVVHELVHLHEPRHNRAFWQRVEQAMPDFAERKQWLAENGSRY
ncbi:MAG: M48 family metallopeptidase [Chloroflexi bacterium]|nr:M48 family metallopeptidase [Ktedonobacteraceae bacterium]MBV9706186.1 M48 family metallopeptidase [Chloroflexota bacterium]